MQLRVTVLVVVVLAVALRVHATARAPAPGDFYVNTQVDQLVDLTGHIITVHHSINAKPTSVHSASKPYVFDVAPVYGTHVVAVLAAMPDGQQLPVELRKHAEPVAHRYHIDLTQLAGKKGGTITFSVTVTLAHHFELLPSSISQAEPQLVVFRGDALFWSPYVTTRQVTSLLLASSAVEEFATDVEPHKRSRDKIVYGPFGSQPAFAAAPIRAHFENNSPFMTATHVLKEVTVSSWGSVTVEEHYTLANTGATLRGGFSRLDYTMNMMRANSFQRVVCGLPVEATGLYYRDTIGNISTSTVIHGDSFKELELKARFPVFGGWKTQFYVGYSVPLSSVSFVDPMDSGRTHLRIPFGPSLLEAVVDSVTVKMVLPHGASNIDTRTTVPSIEQQQRRRVSLLNTSWSSQPVVVLTSGMMVDATKGQLDVAFTFPNPVFSLSAPLFLLASLLLAVVTYRVVSRKLA